MIYDICRIWGRTWYTVIGIRHQEKHEVPREKKQYIFVANHISYLDIPSAVLGIAQPFRALGKAEMKVVPVFGWIYRIAVVMVNRKSAADRAKSIRSLKAVLKKGISILIFPEGTFNETGKTLGHFYDGAFRIAIETQTPIKPLLLIDTLKRMHYRSLFEINPGINRVIHLEEVDVTGYTLDDVQLLKEKVKEQMREGLERYAQ